MTKALKRWTLRAVWPDWAIFELLDDQFSYKSCPNIMVNCWAILNNSTFMLKMIWLLLGNIWENLATFYYIIWSHFGPNHSNLFDAINSFIFCFPSKSRHGEYFMAQIARRRRQRRRLCRLLLRNKIDWKKSFEKGCT